MGKEIEIITEEEFVRQFKEITDKLIKFMEENRDYHPLAYVATFLIISRDYVKYADIEELLFIKYAAKQILKEIKKVLKRKKTKQHI